MRIIEPFAVTPGMMVSSNVVENDHPTWSSSTTYVVGDRIVHNHGIWESVKDNNVGKNPTTDVTQEWWVRLGATNRWRAFDGKLGGRTIGGSTISYTISLPRTLNAICMFGLDGSEVRIKVTAPGSVVVYDQTIRLSYRPPASTFWEYIYTPFSFKPDLILTGLHLPSGATVEITIVGGDAAKVGEIFLGRDIRIGTTLVGSRLGVVDYSKEDRDEWGGVSIIQRPVTRTANFQFAIPTEDASRVQDTIQRITSKVCVFYAVTEQDNFGLTVAGILRDYDLTLDTSVSFGNIQAESLT